MRCAWHCLTGDDRMSIVLSEFHPRSELILEEHPTPLPRFPVWNTHTHFGTTYYGERYAQVYDAAREVALLRAQGVKCVVNLDGGDGDALLRMLAKTADFSDFFVTFGTPALRNPDKPDFVQRVQESLYFMKDHGVRGLKFFKEFSFGALRDGRGEPVYPDDARLAVLWETAAQLRFPVVIHIADPPAFFRPIDGANERYDELGRHPEWSFEGCGLSFAQMMAMQERLLRDNPKTQFIVAHVGSYAENLQWVSACLERYPNMHLDIAARISELGRQPYSAADFFARWQDRILFGTDGGAGNTAYSSYYRFLESRDEYFPYSGEETPRQGRWNIYGLGLEDTILRKVYFENAEKLIVKRMTIQ